MTFPIWSLPLTVAVVEAPSSLPMLPTVDGGPAVATFVILVCCSKLLFYSWLNFPRYRCLP